LSLHPAIALDACDSADASSGLSETEIGSIFVSHGTTIVARQIHQA
jgi:hypothetical protein